MGRKTTCKICGRKGLRLNRKRHCLNCAMNRVNAVVKQLIAKKGKHYKKWKRNTLRGIKNA